MKIGLFGGTFDPVHDEHVKIVTTAIAELNLDKVIVLPAYVSPFKDREDTSSEEDRLNMVRLAFDGIERVEVSDYEIKKAAVSYTSETVTYFKKLYKKDDLYFIMGEDSLKTFRKWNRPDVIVKNAEIVVCGRYGSYVDFDAEQNYFDLHYGKKFIKTDYEGSSVSSTKVRTYSRLNIPLGGMVPEKVGKYIKEKNLYGVNDYAEYLRSVLTEKRLIHTANVVTAALIKGKELKLDSEKVELAATLHDHAKYLDPENYKNFRYKGIPQQVVHAYLGAYLAETELGITDRDVLDAIKYHTTAKAGMTDLQKLIFTADMIEDGRDYDGVERLRELFYTEALDVSFKACLKEECEHLAAKGYELFVETLNAAKYYLKNK